MLVFGGVDVDMECRSSNGKEIEDPLDFFRVVMRSKDRDCPFKTSLGVLGGH